MTMSGKIHFENLCGERSASYRIGSKIGDDSCSSNFFAWGCGAGVNSNFIFLTFKVQQSVHRLFLASKF